MRFSHPSAKYAVFAGLLISLFLAMNSAAAAHPLDEFYQVTFLEIGPERVELIVELYTGVLIAPQVLAQVDDNADDQISGDEAQAYAEDFVADLTLEVDGAPVPLQIDSHDFASPLDLRAGVGVIRLFLHADLPASTAGLAQLFYENNHQPQQAVYVVSAISQNPEWVELSNQQRDVLQQSLRLDYTVAADAPRSPAGEPPQAEAIELPTGAPTEGQKWLTGYLYDANLSPLWIAVILAASLALGGLHALTPGHGKTLVAAYLIGSRGTVAHAVTLGGIVTFTHTASVILIGLLALLASAYILPNVLVPGLEIISGLLVVWIGFQLIWSRWRDYRSGETDHHHHEHSHLHDEDDHHHHHHDIPENVTMRDLLALGISGGLVPCPEALGIMLVAIGLNRILLGLGMVVSFSFGLAAVLIIIGILLVRAKSLLDGMSRAGQRWQLLLPLASAVIVTLLGAGITLKGVWSIWGG